MENQTQENLLKAVQAVLTEALGEFEALSKMDIQMAEDPSKPMIADAQDDSSKDDDSSEDDEDAKKKKEEEDKKKQEDEDAKKSESAAAEAAAKAAAEATIVKSEPAAIVAAPAVAVESESLKKAEAQIEELKKSYQENIETLKKSHDAEMSDLKKSLNEMSEKVAKIGSQSVARKGAAGYAPIKKSETDNLDGSVNQPKPLSKSQIVDQLLDLKKSGKAVDTALVNRVETNRMTAADAQFIKGTLGL